MKHRVLLAAAGLMVFSLLGCNEERVAEGPSAIEETSEGATVGVEEEGEAENPSLGEVGVYGDTGIDDVRTEGRGPNPVDELRDDPEQELGVDREQPLDRAPASEEESAEQ